MQLVILAGGYGTRISEETSLRPKPMVEIGGIPIIVHIMNYYSSFGINEFIICGGYKCEYIKKYFYNYFLINNDIELNFKSNTSKNILKKKSNWKIKIFDTGLETMTGGRLLKVRKFIKDENFLMTYGDGLSTVNIKDLIKFHLKMKKVATLSAVNPPSRFGVLKINNDLVEVINEKPVIKNNFINGGFFVFKKAIFDYLLNGDKTILEDKPLKDLARNGQLTAFKHTSFWQPMDTLRDKKYLEKLWNDKKAPWKIW